MGRSGKAELSSVGQLSKLAGSQGGWDGATVVCGHLHPLPSLCPLDQANEAGMGQYGLSQGTKTRSPILEGASTHIVDCGTPAVCRAQL